MGVLRGKMKQLCLRACVRATCMHACMHACVHTCMHACMHACMCACMHARFCEFVRACMRPCVSFLRICACMSASIRVRMCIRTYVRCASVLRVKINLDMHVIYATRTCTHVRARFRMRHDNRFRTNHRDAAWPVAV